MLQEYFPDKPWLTLPAFVSPGHDSRVRGLVIHSTVVWPLTSRGRSLIYFCHVTAGICICLLWVLDYE